MPAEANTVVSMTDLGRECGEREELDSAVTALGRYMAREVIEEEWLQCQAEIYGMAGSL